MTGTVSNRTWRGVVAAVGVSLATMVVPMAFPLMPVLPFGLPFAAELAGSGRPGWTAAVAGLASAPVLLVGLLLPPLLPVGVLLGATAAASYARIGAPGPLPEVAAGALALERFAARRTALGRHYRWRLALWVAPQLALVGLLATGAAMALASGLAAPALPLVLIRGLGEPLALLGVAGAVFLAFALVLVGLVATLAALPLTRIPAARLARASWPEWDGAASGGGWTTLLLALVDTALLGALVAFLAAATAAVAAPGLGGPVSLPAVGVLGAAFVLRLTFADVAALTRAGPLSSARATARLAVGFPAALVRAAGAWWVGLAAVAGVGLAVAAAPLSFAQHLPPGTARSVVLALAAAVGLAGAGWVVAPGLLLLKLYRLAVIDRLLGDRPAAADPEPAGPRPG